MLESEGGRLEIDFLTEEWLKTISSDPLSICSISNCRNTLVFVLRAVTDHVVIKSCERCRIVIAACLGSVCIENCEAITFTCASKSIQLCKTLNCILFAFCLNPIRIDSESSNVTIGPFNAVCSKLNDTLKRYSDIFDPNTPNPTDFAVEDDNSDRCAMIKPEEFVLNPIPFEPHGSSVFKIPSAYQKGLNQRQERLLKIQELLKTSCLSDSERGTVQAELERRFKRWLEESGEHIFISVLRKPMYAAS